MGYAPDRFVEECREALATSASSLREPLEHVARLGTQWLSTVGSVRAKGGVLHHSPDLTILVIEWPPGMAELPHNHRMTAGIAMISGREDHSLFKRRDATTLTSSGRRVLSHGDVLLLGDDAIHSVTNPDRAWSAAVHIYAGDFFNAARLQWDSDGTRERPLDVGALVARYAGAVAAAPPSPWSDADGCSPSPTASQIARSPHDSS